MRKGRGPEHGPGEDEVVASEAANEDSDVRLWMGEAVWVEGWSICCSVWWDITITSVAHNPHLHNHYEGRETGGSGISRPAAAFKPDEC